MVDRDSCSEECGLFSTVVEHSPFAHLVFERGRCVYYSPSYPYLVRSPADAPLDDWLVSLPSLIHDADRERVLSAFQTATRTREDCLTYVFRGRCHDGVYRWREDSAHLFYDEYGAHVKTVVAAREVPETESSHLAALGENYHRLIGELMHRTKNDLHLVQAFLSLQANRSSDPRLRESLEEASGRISAVGAVYESVYRAKRVGSVALERLLRELVVRIQEKQGATNYRYDLEVYDGAVPMQLAIAVAIILNELLTNTAKYVGPLREQRRSTAGIDAWTTEREDGIVAITLRVRDTGPGFPAEVLNDGAYGFGLEMVQALVGQYDGSLELRNDGGGIVTVVLQAPSG